MIITLNEDEIRGAVETYVRSQIAIAENQTLTVDFTAGRGPNGLSATLDIKAKPVSAAATKPSFTPRAMTAPPAPAAQPKTKPQPEPEAEAIEEEAAVEEAAEETANISTGEERVDPEAEEPAEEETKANPFKIKREAPAAAEETEEAPKPAKSIFSRKGS